MDTRCPACHRAVSTSDATVGQNSTAYRPRCTHCGCFLPLPGNSDPSPAPGGAVSDAGADWLEDAPADPGVTIVGQPPEDGESRVAHFVLIRILGKGGFGAVWLARDTLLDRLVALKLPKDPDDRLMHEAQTAAKLRHPHIVSIFEVGLEDSRAWIASEYIEGITLKEELQRGRPSVDRAVAVMLTIAEAAHHAHQQGVVHRDLKPTNVMIDSQGQPYIMDFGIAKSTSDEATISHDGQIVGTIAYMAPEQAAGRNSRTDYRADVYAMGVMLFELLTETKPFHGNAQGILYQKSNRDAPSPATLVPNLPRDLVTICQKCLERDPDKRYQSAQDLADELQRFRDNVPILARPVSRPEKLWRWCMRNPTLAAGIIGFITLLSVSSAAGWYLRSVAEHSRATTAETLYRARMVLAGYAYSSGDYEALDAYLQPYQNPELAGYRDFAWRYYQNARSPIIQTLNYGGPVTDVSLSRTGEYVAAAEFNDAEVSVWSVADGKLIRRLETSGQRCLAHEFSPGDDRLLTAASDGTLQVWNPVSHNRVAFELRHGPGLTCAGFSPDRRLIASADSQGHVRLWNVSAREQVNELQADGGAVQRLAFSSDSQSLALLVSPGTTPGQRRQTRVLVVDPRTAEVRFETEPRHRATSLVFAENDTVIVTIAQDGTLCQFSADNGEFLRQERPHVGHALGDIAWVPSMSRYVVSTGGQVSLLLDQELRETRRVPTHSANFGVVAASGDGTTLAVGGGDGSVRVLNAARLKLPTAAFEPNVIRHLCFSGSNILAAREDGVVEVWNTETGEFTDMISVDPTQRAILAIAVNSDATKMAACGMMRDLAITDFGQDADVQAISLPPGGHSALAWSPDDGLIAVGSRQQGLLLFRLEAPEEPAAVMETESAVRDLCFSSDSRLLAAALQDQQIVVYDVTGAERQRIETYDLGQPAAVHFISDDQQLVVATQHGYIAVCDVATGHTVAKWRAHGGAINDLALLDGGRSLVSGGRDRMLKIWDFKSRQIICQLRDHDRAITAIAVSRDGATIASAGILGDLRVCRTR